MTHEAPGGYAGRMLRADLSSAQCSDERFEESTLRKWVGGSGIGAKILYDEVPPEVTWDAPENRLIIATGPLAGTKVMGSGTFSAVTVGPMTGGATTTQANGFLGAFMKMAGFDGVILQGRSERWVYLYLHDGVAELRDAEQLLGLDTWEMHEAIAAELGKKASQISVFGVGPAGERLVRFAAIAGDHGHVAGHNGSGAVMGSKRVKAIVAARGGRVAVADEAALGEAAARLTEAVMANPAGRNILETGTSMLYLAAERGGYLPVKNYTTSLFPEAADFMGDRYRPAFEAKPAPCWACRSKHLHTLTIQDGPYKGFMGDEPEYEQWAAWGSLIGNTDVAGAVVLSNETDRLGLENNEAGWVVAWVMECFERGILTKEDTGGLEMTWGNVEATRAILRKIANREGIGGLLAEGVKRASEKLGRGSEELAVYTMKGNSPRGHDHRGRWYEMLDTATSDTGTIAIGPAVQPEEQGAPAQMGAFDPGQISETAGRHAGRMVFEDCLGTCRFTTRGSLPALAATVAAATGWRDFGAEEGFTVGRRTINLLRAFNLRRGLAPALEYPSKRYGSTPVDGPVAGRSVAPHWEEMRADYYRWMGWDLESGRPLPETLAALGLPEVSAQLWG
jgi:aldehyde:ferredoxin oxidoreductase